jgi:high-affinity iron transporter
MLLIVTSLAVLREGSETVLFLYGLAAGGQWSSTLLGGLIGLLAGGVLGWLLYRGLLRIPIRHFFTVTGWLVLLLAAGLAASAASYLTQAGLLPTLGGALWDTSDWLSERSWPGMLLHILIGYNDRPTGIQVLMYVTTLCVILGLMHRFGHRPPPVATAAAGDRPEAVDDNRHREDGQVMSNP